MKQRAELDWAEVGRVLTIRIRGEIDHHTAAPMRADIDELLFSHRPTELVLDMSGVSFMDSSGLGLIMGRYGILRQLGGRLILEDPSPETVSILRLAGMENTIQTVTTTPPKGAEHGRTSSRRPRMSRKTTEKGRKIV